MLTPKDAKVLSKLVNAPDMFPEARKDITRTLLDYYKELLTSNKRMQIPVVRRMW